MKSPHLSRNRTSSKPAQTASPRLRAVLFCAAIATLTAIPFIAVLRNQFVNWDDYETLVNNSHYRGWGWPQLRWMWTTFYMGHYQPLSWLTFSLDYAAWGANPAGYHLTNLLLHALNAVLFFLVARFLLCTALGLADMQEWRALDFTAALAALLFSIHPLRVESVAWATERRDVLSGVFFLVALYGYLRYQDSSAQERRGQWLLISLSAYVLSLAAKATAITLPVILLLLDVYPLRRWSKSHGSDRKKMLWEKAPFLTVAIVFAALALLAQQSAGALRPVKQYFFSYRLGQAAYGVIFYLWKSILPLDLAPLYELPYDFADWTAVFVLSAILAVAITVGFFLARRRWPAGLACWIYYIVLLAPVLGVAQSGPQLVADRYSYLASMSWAVLIGGGFFWLLRGRRETAIGSAAASGCVLLILGALTFRQTAIWHDTPTLWRHVIAVAPPSSIAHYNFGRELEDQGKFADALGYYNKAVAINPANPDAQYNLARLLARQGKHAEAIEHYRLALAIRPNDADTHNNLGLLLAQRGELDSAVSEFTKAVKVDPIYAKGYFNLGRAYGLWGDVARAIDNLEIAFKLKPDESEVLTALAEAHTAWARQLATQGNMIESEKHYQRAVEILRSQKTLGASQKPNTISR